MPSACFETSCGPQRIVGISDLLADILQPRLAALTDGVAQLPRIINAWSAQHG